MIPRDNRRDGHPGAGARGRVALQYTCPSVQAETTTPDSYPTVRGAWRTRNQWTWGLEEETDLAAGRAGAFLRPAPRNQSDSSCRGEPRARLWRAPLLVPGQGGSSGSPLSRTSGVPGWLTTCSSVRGGVCNSLESCTEPGSAQPQCSSLRRRRNEAFRGAGRGHGHKRPVP